MSAFVDPKNSAGPLPQCDGPADVEKALARILSNFSKDAIGIVPAGGQLGA